MSLPDDFVRLEGGPLDGNQLSINVWPPPEELQFQKQILVGDGEAEPGNSLRYRRVSYSGISDEQAAKMPNVARGGLYEYVDEIAVH